MAAAASQANKVTCSPLTDSRWATPVSRNSDQSLRAGVREKCLELSENVLSYRGVLSFRALTAAAVEPN
jgi:hypothetical protein